MFSVLGTKWSPDPIFYCNCPQEKPSPYSHTDWHDTRIRNVWITAATKRRGACSHASLLLQADARRIIIRGLRQSHAERSADKPGAVCLLNFADTTDGGNPDVRAHLRACSCVCVCHASFRMLMDMWFFALSLASTSGGTRSLCVGGFA